MLAGQERPLRCTLHTLQCTKVKLQPHASFAGLDCVGCGPAVVSPSHMPCQCWAEARPGESSAMNPLAPTVSDMQAGADDVPARLAVARNLARIYTEVLEVPLPEALRYLIQKWEAPDTGKGTKAS